MNGDERAHNNIYDMSKLLYSTAGYLSMKPHQRIECKLLQTIFMTYLSNITWAKFVDNLWHFIWHLNANSLNCSIRSSGVLLNSAHHESISLIARFMGPTWGPHGADRTQVGPMLAPWTLLSGYHNHVRVTSQWKYYVYPNTVFYLILDTWCVKE